MVICNEWLVLKLGHVIFLKFDVISPRGENALFLFLFIFQISSQFVPTYLICKTWANPPAFLKTISKFSRERKIRLRVFTTLH